jgi:hypothetical protein
MMKKFIYIICLLFTVNSSPLFAQTTGAVVSGNTILLPRITRATITSPFKGQILYDTAVSHAYVYNGTAWALLDSGSVSGGGSLSDLNVTHPLYWLNDSTLAVDTSGFGGGSGNTNSNVGSYYRWAIPGTNNIKTFRITGPATIDSTTSNTLTVNIPGNVSAFTNDAGYLTNITGKITAGTNVTITGSGTSGSPYNISASGGGGGTTDKQSFTLTAAQTAITITGLPTSANDYDIFYNTSYLDPSFYTTSGTTLTFTFSNAQGGDKVYYARKK